MKFFFDIEELEKMSVEQLEELEDRLWDERSKVITILKYKKIKREAKKK